MTAADRKLRTGLSLAHAPVDQFPKQFDFVITQPGSVVTLALAKITSMVLAFFTSEGVGHYRTPTCKILQDNGYSAPAVLLHATPL